MNMDIVFVNDIMEGKGGEISDKTKSYPDLRYMKTKGFEAMDAS